MILTKKVMVNLNNGTINYYRELGYNTTDKKQIIILVSDLKKNSHTQIQVKCAKCGSVKEMMYKTYNKITNNNKSEYYCSKCKSEKIKQTNLEKYGVENIFQYEKIKEKIKHNNIEKYGVDYYQQTDNYKNKVKNTNLERYGVSSYTKTEKCKLKIKQTKKERYGDANYNNKEKMILTIRENEKKNIINKAKKIHGDLYDYSLINNYENMVKKEKIICKKHGVFYQSMGQHIYSKHGCPKCRESKGEKKIRLYLEEKKILYISQKKFKECKNKRELPFDFYLPELNICIEYDGEQHYKSFEYFGGEEKFLQTLLNDIIKTEFCDNNNIKLIRYKYDEEIDFSKIKKES